MIYYPGYEAKLGDEVLEVGYSGKNGLVAVEIPAGKSGKVQVWYGLSLATKVGAAISAGTVGLGVLWLIVAGIIEHRGRKKEERAIAEEARLMDSVFSAMEEEAVSLDEPAITMEDLMPPKLENKPEAEMKAPEVSMPLESEPKAVAKKTTKKRTTKAKKTTTKKTVAAKAVEAEADATTSKSSTKTRVVRLPETEASADTGKVRAKSAKTTKTRVKCVKAEED